MSNSTTATVDAVVGTESIGLARDALVQEVGPDMVGSHIEVIAQEARVGTHLFECTSPAYVGWRWSVTLARAPRSKVATVCEVVLVPGPSSLVPPEWVPWSARILPGDLEAGDVLPPAANDPRLTAGLTGADELDAIIDRGEPRAWTGWEIGLGRTRVLSASGRDEAAHRWDVGDYGPSSEMAQAAAKTCASCGFRVEVAGTMSQSFGVCANEFAPADGHIVALSYGCGAHSEVLEPAQGDD